MKKTTQLGTQLFTYRFKYIKKNRKYDFTKSFVSYESYLEKLTQYKQDSINFTHYELKRKY